MYIGKQHPICRITVLHLVGCLVVFLLHFFLPPRYCIILFYIYIYVFFLFFLFCFNLKKLSIRTVCLVIITQCVTRVLRNNTESI